MDKMRELKSEVRRRNAAAEREAFRQVSEQYMRLPLMIDCGEHCELSESLTRSMNDLVARRDGTTSPNRESIAQLLEFQWSFPSLLWQSAGSRLVSKPTRLYFANTLAFFRALQLLCDWAEMLARLAKDLDSSRYPDCVECLAECRKWLDNEGGCPHIDAAALAECLVWLHELLRTEAALAVKTPRPKAVILSGFDERAQADLALTIRAAKRKPKPGKRRGATDKSALKDRNDVVTEMRRLRKKTKLPWPEIVSRMRKNSAYKSRMSRISDKTWIRYAS